MLPSSAPFFAVLLSVGVVSALAVHYVVTSGRRLIFAAETLFLGLAACAYHTTLTTALAGQSAAGMQYAFFVGGGIVCFVCGTVVARFMLRFDHRRELESFMALPWLDDVVGAKRAVVLGVGGVAAAVTTLYFVSLGTFVPLGALAALIDGGPVAMTARYNELRSLTYSGAYLGLGYVIQFKDVLVVLVAALFMVQFRLRSRDASPRWLAFFLVVAVVAAVGTGNRTSLALLGGLFLLLGTAPYLAPARFSVRQRAAMAVGALGLLTGLTLMMGSRGIATPFQSILWAPHQVLERVCIAPSRERLLVFERFLVHQDARLGQGAIDALSIALPGRAEYTLPNQLHELLYGNPAGNVGLDVWGSLWLDWRWGGLLFAFGMGAVYHATYVWLLRGRKSVIRVVSLTYAVFILGLATDLQVLLLHGFATVLLFWALSEAAAGMGVPQRLDNAADGRG